MVIGGHVVEEVVVVSHLVGFFVADEVLVAGSETVISAGDGEVAECFFHCVLESESLCFVHAWREVPAFDVSGNSGSHGNTLEVGVDAGEQVLADGDVPAVLLLGVALDAVVLSDQWLEIEGEGVVVLGSGGIGSN